MGTFEDDEDEEEDEEEEEERDAGVIDGSQRMAAVARHPRLAVSFALLPAVEAKPRAAAAAAGTVGTAGALALAPLLPQQKLTVRRIEATTTMFQALHELAASKDLNPKAKDAVDLHAVGNTDTASGCSPLPAPLAPPAAAPHTLFCLYPGAPALLGSFGGVRNIKWAGARFDK